MNKEDPEIRDLFDRFLENEKVNGIVPRDLADNLLEVAIITTIKSLAQRGIENEEIVTRVREEVEDAIQSAMITRRLYEEGETGE